MMKFSWCFLVLGMMFSGCLKSDKGCPYKESDAVAPASEQQSVEAYLSANGITAVKHSSGLYYQVVDAGSGKVPQLCSSVSVGYSGKLTNGTTFDQQNLITFDLGRVIVGWQKGLPLIQKGGHIKLYIPPTLGYGAYDIKNNSGAVVIPANSILIFDVEIFDVN
ncbi:MAG TPA: FKBP-type peptidyl-prolyl cis-trans isomerase [Chitinophagaceae bacterium]|nr:FKBP-type peptidyl-prolyl cis-trans isomerase [Chitinophagaceae bacterium]